MRQKAIKVIGYLIGYGVIIPPITLGVCVAARRSPVPMVATQETDLPPTQETDLPENDSYTPVIENYLSLNFCPIKQDFLYNTAKQFPVKKFNGWGICSANFSVLYACRINKSRFAICPGAGYSSLSYKSSSRKSDGKDVYKRFKKTNKSFTDCQDIVEEGDLSKINGAMLEVRYFDLLFRLRFNSVIDEPKEGVHLWAGLKMSFFGSAKQCIEGESKYEEVINTKCSVTLGRPVAVACQFGMGYKFVGIMGEYYLTPLFGAQKGPSGFHPFSIGLYLDLL